MFRLVPFLLYRAVSGSYIELCACTKVEGRLNPLKLSFSSHRHLVSNETRERGIYGYCLSKLMRKERQTASPGILQRFMKVLREPEEPKKHLLNLQDRLQSKFLDETRQLPDQYRPFIAPLSNMCGKHKYPKKQIGAFFTRPGCLDALNDLEARLQDRTVEGGHCGRDMNDRLTKGEEKIAHAVPDDTRSVIVGDTLSFQA